MANQPPTERVGVAPSRCCFNCGAAATLSTPTGQPVCGDCENWWPWATPVGPPEPEPAVGPEVRPLLRLLLDRSLYAPPDLE